MRNNIPTPAAMPYVLRFSGRKKIGKKCEIFQSKLESLKAASNHQSYLSIGKDLEVKEGTVWDLTIRVHRAELGLAYNVYFIQSQHTTGLVQYHMMEKGTIGLQPKCFE